jgi:hypothetical protein
MFTPPLDAEAPLVKKLISSSFPQEKIQNSKYKVEITTVKIKMASLEKELNHYKGLEKQGLLHQKELRQEELSSKVPVFYMSIALCKNSTGTLGLARSLVYDETKKLLVSLLCRLSFEQG